MAEPSTPSTYGGFPVVTAAQARELDRLATEQRGIAALELMENAGRAVADETASLLKESRSASVVVCCGRGANGGDGLVAARYLSRRGARVTVFLCPPRKDGAYPDLVRVNLRRALEAGAGVFEPGTETELTAALERADAAVDALLGTGSSGRPTGSIERMIELLNRSGKPVVAVDLPSGLDPDTGVRGGACVRAALTVTFGFAKRGLLRPEARDFVGLLKVADIGYPRDLTGSV